MPEEEQRSESNLPEAPKNLAARRRGRRGGRGRRHPASSSAPISELQNVPVEGELSEPREKPQPQPQISHSSRRRGSPLLEAADEVVEVIESLKRTLAQMEKVLELIEIAGRQKISDEHEIESLRRAVRRIQQPHER